MRMEFEIRALEQGDRTAWEPLWQGYLKFYKSELTADVTESTWYRLMTPDESPHGLCAVDADGRLVGIVHYVFHRSTWSIADECYLGDLFVAPTVRGGGVGRGLIDAVGVAAREHGAGRVYWHTQSFNDTARRLYDSVATLTPFVKYELTGKG